MKFFTFLFSLSLLTGSISFAQTAKLTDSEILKQYRKLKHDLEEKARTIKDLPYATEAEKEEAKENYKLVSKTFNQFIAAAESDFAEAKSKGYEMKIEEFDNSLFEDLMLLYKIYEENFIEQYEGMVGFSTKPVLPNNLEETIKNCEDKKRCGLPVNSKVIENYIATRGKVEKWANL